MFATNNCILRPVEEKDAWRLCDFVTINSDRLKTYFPKTLEQNLTPDLSQYFVQRKLKEFQNNTEFVFVLKEQTERSIVGILFVKEIDWTKGEAELCYAIGASHEGKGIVSKSVAYLSEWSFEKQLKTLRIIVNKENQRSIQVAERCGFHWKETLLNEFTPANGISMDMELYVKTSSHQN